MAKVWMSDTKWVRRARIRRILMVSGPYYAGHFLRDSSSSLHQVLNITSIVRKEYIS